MVEEATMELNSVLIVRGQTEIGAFMGRWMSKEIAPEVGKKYSCELSLPDLRASDMRIIPYGNQTPVYTDIDLRNRVVFKGVVCAAEGGIVVSFAPDWIECFEIIGKGLRVHDAVMFVLEKEDIAIYPYEEI